MRYNKSFGGREKYFPTKYKKDRTNDCVIRAISHATGIDYKTVFKDLLDLSWKTGHLPDEERCYGVYLERLGWKKHKPFRRANNRLLKVGQIQAFNGTFLVHTSRHLTCVKDGELYDSWDCRKASAYSYYQKERNTIATINCKNCNTPTPIEDSIDEWCKDCNKLALLEEVA